MLSQLATVLYAFLTALLPDECCIPYIWFLQLPLLAPELAFAGGVLTELGVWMEEAAGCGEAPVEGVAAAGDCDCVAA